MWKGCGIAAQHSLSHRRCLCLDALRLQLAKMMDDQGTTTTMMAHANQTSARLPAHRPCPTTPDAASRPTTTLLYQWPARCAARPRLPLSMAMAQRLTPARDLPFLPWRWWCGGVLVLPAYQRNDSTQSLPLRQHLLVSAISLTKPPARIASRTRHPPGKAMR